MGITSSAACVPTEDRAEPDADARRIGVSLSVSGRHLVVEVPIDDRVLAVARELIAGNGGVLRGATLELAVGAGDAPDAAFPTRNIRLVVDDAEPRDDAAPAHLTTKERDLLAALRRARGRVVTRAELLREVWGYGPDVVSRTLDTHIGTLRRKLEPIPRRPRHILTVRNVGYRWQD